MPHSGEKEEEEEEGMETHMEQSEALVRGLMRGTRLARIRVLTDQRFRCEEGGQALLQRHALAVAAIGSRWGGV